MTQQQLAQKINKDQKTIQLYESGKVAPDYTVMCKIEKALGIKLNKKKSIIRNLSSIMCLKIV